jgi:hypothetical protein
MGKIKKFIGEYAYKCIKNMAYNTDALRKSLVTPANARAVFSELTEYEIKSLVADISNSGTIGTVRNTTQEEIIAAFAKGGYTTVIFDDEQAIAECKKYYRDGEVICTYNNLKRRMEEYHMLVAIKENIDNIERSKNPQRDDEYGTSILNIQIAKNGSHMSIKNRYNHTVDQCDSTFNNDLNHITMGLQSMVLGYYGFAGMTKANNKYYNNIVNIGGIYLKYHTERNNIYFGDFVLDGVNGARFTDSSQYYITKGIKNTYKNMPMVLDFKNKVAIDLIGDNGKIPLISRALKEGILHSGNKEQAENICATFPEAKKELLKANKKALKYVAEVYGYDFQKPYKITGILGKFTAKSIEKIIGSNNALLLMSDNDELRAVKLNYGKFQVKDIKGGYEYNIHSFYTQGDFESKRKSGEKATYIIQQDERYIREIKEKNSGRIGVYVNNRMRCFELMTESEIARINLKRRLEDYKADKRKKEVQATDYTAEIIKIKKAFTTLKTEIVSILMNASTYEDYKMLSNITDHKLVWLVRDIENFKNNAITKSFISNEQAQDSMNSIYSTITKLWNIIKQNNTHERKHI